MAKEKINDISEIMGTPVDADGFAPFNDHIAMKGIAHALKQQGEHHYTIRVKASQTVLPNGEVEGTVIFRRKENDPSKPAKG